MGQGMKPKPLTTYIILALGVVSALAIIILGMQNLAFENKQEQYLREEISIMMKQLMHVINAMEQLTQNQTIEELLDLQTEVSRMKGVLFKQQSKRLVNYGSLTNPFSSLEDFLRLAPLECSSDGDAIGPYMAVVTQLKIHLLELNSHFERVYGTFVRGQIKSQDIQLNTLQGLNEVISIINGRVAKTIHSRNE